METGAGGTEEGLEHRSCSTESVRSLAFLLGFAAAFRCNSIGFRMVRAWDEGILCLFIILPFISSLIFLPLFVPSSPISPFF